MDLNGTRQCIKGGVLASRSAHHVRARICVVGRSRKERAQGLVRVQFEISVRGFWQRQETISVEVAIRANNGEKRFDLATPFDPIHPQTSAHTSIALRPGEGASVFGVAHLLSGDIVFFGYFIVPDESVYGP